MRLRTLLAATILFFLAAPPSGADFMRLPAPHPHMPMQVERLSKGEFLVAAPSMTDPRFSGTTVLLLEYGAHGAVGLIINKPTGIKLSRAFGHIKGFEKDGRQLYLGGPVGIDQVFILLRSEKVVNGASRVLKDVYVSTSEKVLERAAGGKFEFRVFAGFAGWAPFQLDREVSMGIWSVVDGDADVIFSGKHIDAGKSGSP